MSENQTKIICPVCGASFALPEHTHIASGTVIGKDSNLGTIALKLDSSHKLSASEKLTALQNAGVDTSNLFAITDAQGISKLASIQDGMVAEIKDNNPILAHIYGKGAVPNRKLFRRWVMSQMFHMLVHPNGFDAALQQKGYTYQWRVLIEELRVQAKLYNEDLESFKERNQWFNKSVAMQMANDYRFIVMFYCDTAVQKRFQGASYIQFRQRNVLVSDIQTKIFVPIHQAICCIDSAMTPSELHMAVQKFYKLINKTYVHFDLDMTRVFVNAYKGAGAYFTMKNLIMFHNCFMHIGTRTLSLTGSLKKLNDKAEEYAQQGDCLFDVMKHLIDDNNIDINQKITEWRKR